MKNREIDMKFLVIDDSSTMRRIIKNTIMRLGYKKENLFEAADGEIALEIFKEKGNGFFGIILTDINMPNKDGYGVIKEVRELDSDIPIVTISTEGGKTEVIKALKLGSTNYIVKPFTPQVLKSKLADILGEND